MAASTGTYIPADTSKGSVCAIRLEVQGGWIELDELIVHFGSGQRMHLSTHYIIAGNSSSPSIPLPGMLRTVNGIDILYRHQKSNAGWSTVHLWGNTLPWRKSLREVNAKLNLNSTASGSFDFWMLSLL
jgi:hypothetical protein